MNKEDRRKMIVNCDKLLKLIDWREIWPKLLEHRIFNKDDENVERWESNLDKIDNNREIYLRISTRGPNAFRGFVQSLKDIGRRDLATILKADSADQVDNEIINVIPESNRSNGIANINANIMEDTLTEESDNFYTLLQHTNETLKVNVKKSVEFMDTSSEKVPCYMMRSKPRGLVLLINNIIFEGPEAERVAAEHDEENLKNLFEQMGFKVDTYNNLTRDKMLEKIKAFTKQPELRRVHSTFVVIMSHGDEKKVNDKTESVVYGVDGNSITDRHILNFFTAANCEDMCNKPKIFIFQTCRGNKAQQIVESSNVRSGRDVTDINQFVPPSPSATPTSTRAYSDMLVAYSTLPGHKAHRDKFTGSWYIQALCEVIMNHAHDTELTRLLQMTDKRLEYLRTHNKECQTSVVTNYGFNKQCFLNPGYFES